VNAYTGHSQNSHTTLNFYYHLDCNWAGAKLVQPSAVSSAIVPVSREVQKEIDDDEDSNSGEDSEPEVDVSNGPASFSSLAIRTIAEGKSESEQEQQDVGNRGCVLPDKAGQIVSAGAVSFGALVSSTTPNGSISVLSSRREGTGGSTGRSSDAASLFLEESKRDKEMLLLGSRPSDGRAAFARPKPDSARTGDELAQARLPGPRKRGPGDRTKASGKRRRKNGKPGSIPAAGTDAAFPVVPQVSTNDQGVKDCRKGVG
jgi:hypothetical protein